MKNHIKKLIQLAIDEIVDYATEIAIIVLAVEVFVFIFTSI